MGLPNIIQSHINDITTLTTKHTDLETKHNTLETKHNTLDAAVVKLTGNQSIGGVKTFTSIPFVKGTAPALTLQNTNMVKGTTPTANQTCLINCYENAGTAAKNRLGLFQTAYRTSGAVDVGLYAYKPEAGSTSLASINVIYPASGNPYGTAPTPDATANGTHIATTAWVRGKGVLIEKGTSYRKYSDGFIEQWGNNVATGATVTLPVAMTTTTYFASCNVISYTGTSARGADIDCITRTTTSIKLGNYSNYQGIKYTWYVCGY